MPPTLSWPLNLVREDYRAEPPVILKSRNHGEHDLVIWEAAIIGEGSDGATVLAGMLGDRRIAVKLLPITLTIKHQRDLAAEVSMWSNLKHARILRYIGYRDVGICQVALLSPYMENGNMLEFITKYPAEDHLKLLQQVADGVHYLHTEAGIVHGDLKCANVLISESRTALLADFGMSTFIKKSEAARQTATNIRYRKTVQFAAPELFTDNAFSPGAPDSDRWLRRSKTMYTDMYAFGMLIYEVITRGSPWEGVHPDKIPEKVTRGERPARPTDCDGDLWQLCEACWAQNPSDRPGIGEVLETLNRLVSAASDRD